MKINSLQLIAFGPFTDTILDFSAPHAGFHIVYGPNEAGKSTALRALRNMLFGIPARTPDSFRHPHPKLRIGAELVRSDGKTIHFVRRKGLRKTLRAADDQSVMDDEDLASFLGGLDREIFEQMFAIDHHDLVQGGEEIISGGGSVGQALFSAGAGLIQLQRLQGQLDETLETLFKPSGSKPRINRTVASLKNVLKHQKGVLLLAKTWEIHNQARREAETRLASNRQQLADCRRARGRLERIREALPLIVRRKEIHAGLLDLEPVPDLPEDFSTRRHAVESAMIVATNDTRRLAESITAMRKRIQALPPPETLLQHAPMVETLLQDLGSFKKAAKDRPALEARMRALQSQAAAKRAQAGIAKGRSLRLTTAAIGAIQELVKTRERLDARLESAQNQRRQLKTAVMTTAEQKGKLARPDDITPLKSKLRTVEAAGPIERQYTAMGRAIEQRETQLDSQLKRQSLWIGTLEELETLALPTRESVDQFEQRFIASAQHIERLQSNAERVERELSKIETDLRKIETGHDLPTEEGLRRARRRRDDGWRLVRGRLDGHPGDPKEITAFKSCFPGMTSLAGAFEKSVGHADQLADRLRREADQVTRKGLLDADMRQFQTEGQKTNRELDKARKRHHTLEDEWRQLWDPCGILPRSPVEMRGWLADVVSVREKATDLRLEKTAAAALSSEITALQKGLIEALTGSGGAPEKDQSLSGLIDNARQHVESQEVLCTRITTLDQRSEQLQQDLVAIETEIDDLGERRQQWQDRWLGQIQQTGLEADTGPAAALAVIETIREAETQQDEADILSKRIQGIDQDAAAFHQRVQQLGRHLAEDIAGAPPEEVSLRLNARLNEARAVQSRRHDMERQLEAALREQTQNEKRLQDETARMQSLCLAAGCDDPALLPDIEKRVREHRSLSKECRNIETRLRQLSGGAAVDTFAAEAETVQPDAIEPELVRLKEDIHRLEQERSVLDRTIGTEKSELKRMKGQAAAAEYAEEAEHLLADLETDVAHYARVKIASVILARTIEKYREKHQAPLIQRASALFRQMTQNAFTGLRAEYDEKGQPVLVALRNGNGEMVRVAGMSDGTADQLYLALRLASLEQYLSGGEPLPFIVDDILLRFDDDRAAATLEALFALSRKTQVIFFTHHRHMLGLADATLGAKTIQVHRLESGEVGASN